MVIAMTDVAIFKLYFISFLQLIIAKTLHLY